MNKHTPGPWHARKGDVFNPERTYGIVTEWTREECDVLDDPADAPLRTTVIAEVMTGPTDEADARLIAAAPELLAALVELHSLIMNEPGGSDFLPVDSEFDPVHFAAIEAAVKAIAKATGQ